MFIESTVRTDVYNDSNKNDCLFKIADSTARQTVTNQTLHTSGTLSIAASATDAIGLGEVTDGRLLQIEADGDFSLVINGFADPIVCRRLMTTGRAVFHATCTVTSISITNLSASTVLTGRYLVVGNPTA